MHVTRKDLLKLKKMCNAAKPGEVFIFMGHEVLKEYAKYLIEYLESNLGGNSGKKVFQVHAG